VYIVHAEGGMYGMPINTMIQQGQNIYKLAKSLKQNGLSEVTKCAKLIKMCKAHKSV